MTTTVVVLVALAIGFLILLRGSARVGKEQPPEPSLPPQFWTPRQRLDTERLLMSPDQRAFEVDELRALWAASPDEDVRTDLRADPGPHEPA